MITISIKDTEALKFELKKFDERYLFRGQTGHYLREDGSISIPTSFTRHGCIPPLMIKWTHYSKAILRAFGTFDYHNIELGLAQAILQHYGWRSFFVDLTKSSHVACWFANNQYADDQQIDMCENFEEEPVWLVHRRARFERSVEEGHLYVIDTSVLKKNSVELHDLTEIKTEDCNLRFHAQHACLAQGDNGYLKTEAVVAHFIIPSEVLAAYCQEAEINSTLDLFPPASQDFILNILLNLPWTKLKIDSPIPSYRRSLEIPDYENNFVKHLPPRVTLFEEFWIANQKDEEGFPFNGIPFFKLPEESYYAATDQDFQLDRVTALLRNEDRFVIELDGLTQAPELFKSHEYEKGIYVERIAPSIIAVCGLVVSHPGHRVAGVGANLGWIYSIEGSRWNRIPHTDECPCNNDLRHQLQFSILRIFERALQDGKMVKQKNGVSSHRDLLTISKIKVAKN